MNASTRWVAHRPERLETPPPRSSGPGPGPGPGERGPAGAATARRRRWWLRIATALAVALVGAPPAGGAAAPPLPAAPTVYLALGDSLAVGFGATEPQRLGYVPRLYRSGQQARELDRLLNLARPGEASATFVAGGQLAAAVAAITDPTTDVRLVTLDIGGNDLLALLQLPASPCAADPQGAPCREAVAAALDEFARNDTAILIALRQALDAQPGTERLLVMTYYNPWSGTGAAREAAADAALLGSDRRIDCAATDPGASAVGLNDLIACLGQRYGATVVDGYPPFQGRGRALTHIAEGDVHPTDAGHAVLAAAFRRTLRRRAPGTRCRARRSCSPQTTGP